MITFIISCMQRTREPFLLFQGNLEALKNRGICLFQNSSIFEKDRELMNSQFQTGVCVTAYCTLGILPQCQIFQEQAREAILPLEPLPLWVLSEIREHLEESQILARVDLVDLSMTDPDFRQRVTQEGVAWSAPDND